MRIGAIGLDSSHTLAFTRRIHDLHAGGRTRCRVSCCWDEQTPLGLTSPEIRERAAPLEPFGVRLATSLEELLSTVDGVMVLTADGHRHHDLAMKSLERGLPTFIDKPLTCSVTEAVALLEYTRRRGARCYSASALRFIARVPEMGCEALGRMVKIEATGPVQETPHMPGLWYYGCHSFELVDSLWPRSGGVSRVRASADRERYVIELEYRDPRTASIGLDRSGTGEFAVNLRGTMGSGRFTADLTPSYDGLVSSIVHFFEGGEPHVLLPNIVAIVAAIEGCHRSIDAGGDWIELEQIYEKA